MSRSVADRLRDIVQSAELAARHVGDLNATALSAAAVPRDAALFRLAVVCEAASRLPTEIQGLAPDIEWQKIRNMRNLIVHSYWQIDFSIVVDTFIADLPRLNAEALRLLALVEQNDP